MRWARQHQARIGALIVLSAATALSLGPAQLARAQALCNGVPATIVGTAPGRIDGTDGADVIVGTAGEDQIFGLRGDDLICAGAGNDTLVWNPGDGSDTLEGQGGSDLMQFNGSNAGENVVVSAVGARLRLFRDVASITMDTAEVERVAFAALGGADTIVVADLSGTAASVVSLDLAATGGGGDGQADSVIVNGTSGNDTISYAGGAGGFTVTGLSARVTATGTEGALDSLQINGLAGEDTITADALQAATTRLYLPQLMVLSLGGAAAAGEPAAGAQVGALAAEAAGGAVAAVAPAVKLTLDGGSGADQLSGSSGDDTLLGGTENDRVTAGAGQGADLVEGGDGEDTLVVEGTDSAEAFSVVANGPRVRLDSTVAPTLTLDIGTVEQLVVNAGGGDDSFTAGNGLAPLIRITVDGGAGNDSLLGGDGVDVLLGGDGNDLVDGNRGDDVAFLGAGDDSFRWDPGDGSDVIEGQAGSDLMQFNGANVAENIDLSANGGRLRFFRNVANITMDTDDVERVAFAALGGADTIVVNDLSGTDVTEVSLSLAATGGGGDGQADSVIVNATGSSDVVAVSGSGGQASVQGLAARLTLLGAEPAQDRLLVNALAGDDVVDASLLAADVLALTADGGAGDDVLLGSAGPDTLLGGPDDDVLLGGPGVDVLDGGPGDNVVIQD